MAADNTACFSAVHDAMDKLWFYRSIISIEPPDVVSLQSKLTRPRTVSPPRIPLKSTSDGTRPTKDCVVVDRPLFQLPEPRIRPCTSSPDISASVTSQAKRRRRKARVKSYKSLTELENYELKGFMDLGFTFPREKLNAYLKTMIPGLQRIGEKDQENDQDEKTREVARPYLSEAWLANSLLGIRMRPKSALGDMKQQLKFWAQTVAVLVHREP